MALHRPIAQNILLAETTVQNSEWIDVSEMTDVTFYISSSGTIASGGTVQIQAESPDGVAFPVDTQVITTTDYKVIVTLSGAFNRVRASITAVTDGEYTVSLVAKQNQM